MDIPKLGKYQHYKGHYYEVIAVGYSEATLEPVVIYKGLYDAPADLPLGTTFVRPIASFMEKVVVDGVTKPRFTYVE